MNASWGTWREQFIALGVGSPMTALPAFSIDISGDFENTAREAVILDVGFVGWDQNLHGSYVNTACQLLPAILEYDVVIEREAISLPREAHQGRLVRLANNTKPVDWSATSGTQMRTISAITFWMAISRNANVTVNLSPTGGTNQSYAMDTYTLTPEAIKHLRFGWAAAGRGLVFDDPTDDVVHGFNELMLRGAVMTGSWSNLTGLVDRGVATNQTVIALQTVDQNVFRSNMRWFAGAAVVQMITALLILTQFWGFWSLGCNLSLSPFSTALALNAPLLSVVNSAAGRRGVIEELGNVKIKFGIVDSCSTATETRDGYTTGRLGLGAMQSVVRPRKGDRFYA